MIIEAVRPELGDKLISGAKFTRLVALVREILPGEIWLQTLEDSLRHTLGDLLTQERLAALAWRMAGNIPRLRSRRPVPPWHGQTVLEWAPVQIVAARRERNRRGLLGTAYTFRILAGTACPLVTTGWWSSKQCSYYAKAFGFSKRGSPNARLPPKYPYVAPEQFVGMRLNVLLDPEFSGKLPGFNTADWPSVFDDYNREQLRLRLRVDPGYECPNGFPLALPCHKCYIGYEHCAAATHRYDWFEQKCGECGKRDALFDKEMSTTLCIDCYVKGVYKDRHA